MLGKRGADRFWPERKYGRVLLVTPRVMLHGGFYRKGPWIIFHVITSLQVTNLFVTAHMTVPRDLLLDESVSPCPCLGPMEGDTSDCSLHHGVRCVKCDGPSRCLLHALVLFSMGHKEGLCWQYTPPLHVFLSSAL